ncbi:hypothetical protein R3P38DRAFT_3214056 [Favolaschia claudopus]|uniref:RNase H type-1 domain-containing protein n=1 Tax=Favolaschia claudopus TaxID=2862362 RepID=A0AAW0ABZ8_9AGAR
MEYGLPVWYKPVVEREGTRRAGTVWVAKALGKVQRQACKLITGALRTTATDVLDLHANLLPVHTRLNRSAYNAAARAPCLPPVVQPRSPHLPPLPPRPSISSLSNPSPHPRVPHLQIRFRNNRPAATTYPDLSGCTFNLRRTRQTYSEGGHGENHGTRRDMYLHRRVGLRGGDGSRSSSGHRKGSGHQKIEAFGIVCGAILALDIVADISRLTDVDIFLDCQPAIAALFSPKTQPGQYLLAVFHAILGRLTRTRRTLKIRLRWVPAHVGIAGNELVDTLAKEAALGASTPLKTSVKIFESPLPVSRAAAIAAGSKAFTRKWVEEWRTSPRHARIAFFDSPTPSNVVSKMYNGLSRPQCSILAQLRTGHIELNAYLFRFHLAPSPSCPHCNVPESVPHFLLLCPAYRAQRLRLYMRLGTARVTLRRLISSKHDPNPVLAFVRDTHRLPSYAL